MVDVVSKDCLLFRLDQLLFLLLTVALSGLDVSSNPIRDLDLRMDDAFPWLLSEAPLSSRIDQLKFLLLTVSGKSGVPKNRSELDICIGLLPMEWALLGDSVAYEVVLLLRLVEFPFGPGSDLSTII